MRTANSLEDNNPFALIEMEDTPEGSNENLRPKQGGFLSSAPAQSIPPRAYDPLRARFRDMRMIADYAPYAYQNDGWLFYEQAKFMADVTDDYPHRTAFSAFYPYYQRMGYEQLRTYFTWRTNVREGKFPFVGASYLFLYIYELLSGVGTQNPEDGLARLTALWPLYRENVPALDQYLTGWIRDFHIYYDLPHSFSDFVEAQGLQKYYPVGASPEGDDSSGTWLRRSGYDIKKSKFYIGNEETVHKGIAAVFAGLREWCASYNVGLEDLLLYDVSKGEFWKPFTQALFYPAPNQPDRRIEMPGRETYIRRDNRWTVEKASAFVGTRELVGHIIRKTESFLRKQMKYKHKLTADPLTLKYGAQKLRMAGLTLSEMDAVIEQAVTVFHREMNRVAVTVDAGSLVRIRVEALGTQEKLTVEESIVAQAEPRPQPSIPPPQAITQCQPTTFSPSSGWEAFSDSLNVTEREALALLCQGANDLKALADEQGIMLEVLVEGINEKAADFIGDNVLEMDGGIVLFEDYRDMIQRII
jgi:hypothetical protein